MNPFQYANDLMKKKDYVGDCIRERKDYKPFFINRSLSYQPDLIHYANMMNENPMLETKAHYDFLHQTVEKRKRPFRAWIKAKKLDDLTIVKEYYKYSNKKALESLNILTENDINKLKQRLNKGGKSP
jgi:site-specific recombinase XerD